MANNPSISPYFWRGVVLMGVVGRAMMIGLDVEQGAFNGEYWRF